MYNINSPITPNNGYQGGFYNPPNSYLQGNGNMIGIGMQGYNPYMNNGGYYTQNFMPYNPYLAEQQRRAEEARRLNELRAGADIKKLISRKINHALNNEISEQTLNKIYDPVELRVSEEDLILQNNIRLIQIDKINQQHPFVYQNPLYYAMGRVQEMNEQKLDPNASLYDFLSVGGQLISDGMKEEVMRDRTVNNLYNRSEYQKLIDLRSKGNMFGKTFAPNASIDDMEISLPEHLKNEYQRRKELFMEKIINRNSGGI